MTTIKVIEKHWVCNCAEYNINHPALQRCYRCQMRKEEATLFSPIPGKTPKEEPPLVDQNGAFLSDYENRSPDHWDCGCIVNYIRSIAEEEECNACGAHRTNRPSSFMGEVMAVTHLKTGVTYKRPKRRGDAPLVFASTKPYQPYPPLTSKTTKTSSFLILKTNDIDDLLYTAEKAINQHKRNIKNKSGE